jgi:hypothetical protein
MEGTDATDGGRNSDLKAEKPSKDEKKKVVR